MSYDAASFLAGLFGSAIPMVSTVEPNSGERPTAPDPFPDWVLEGLRAADVRIVVETEPAPDVAPTVPVAICQCGSTSWRDVPIHDGQSIRRDCGRCGRFIDFPIWHEREKCFTQ